MKRVLLSLWRDEVGLVQSTDLVFITSIVGSGMLVGLSAYRDGLVDELADNAHAVGALNQSYSLSIAANAPAGITVARSCSIPSTSALVHQGPVPSISS